MHPTGETKGSDLLPSEVGRFFINSNSFGSDGCNAQAVLLIRRRIVNYTNFQKMQIQGLKTTPWKAALSLRGGGLALSKNDHVYLVLE